MRQFSKKPPVRQPFSQIRANIHFFFRSDLAFQGRKLGIMERKSTRQHFSTVDEALDKVQRLQLMCERMPELYGYKSADIVRHQRKLVALANSLSVVFLQYDLFCECFSLLKLAAKVDLLLHATGDVQASTWTSRLVTYNCLAYLFEK